MSLISPDLSDNFWILLVKKGAVVLLRLTDSKGCMGSVGLMSYSSEGVVHCTLDTFSTFE